MNTLLLIGCGNMGGALLARWSALDIDISVLEQRDISLPDNVRHIKTLNEISTANTPDMVILAIKPQQLDSLLPELRARFGSTPAYLSIAAGKTLSYFKNGLGDDAAIIRTMPNTPAMVGEGMTALVATANISEEARNLSTLLFESSGKTLWLSNEAQIDIITAISGSGPAYFFNFMASLAEAAVRQGLSKEDADMLVKQTALGAITLANQSEDGLCQLMDNVTSKGGTTEAALNIFNHDDALETLVNNAVEAAIKRSKELA